MLFHVGVFVASSGALLACLVSLSATSNISIYYAVVVSTPAAETPSSAALYSGSVSASSLPSATLTFAPVSGSATWTNITGVARAGPHGGRGRGLQGGYGGPGQRGSAGPGGNANGAPPAPSGFSYVTVGLWTDAAALSTGSQSYADAVAAVFANPASFFAAVVTPSYAQGAGRGVFEVPPARPAGGRQ